MKSYFSLSDMYLSMIKNAYNNKSKEDLRAIRVVLELTPMGIIHDNQITLTNINYLEELIDTNIEILEEEGR